MKKNKNSVIGFHHAAYWQWNIQTDTVQLSELYLSYVGLSGENNRLPLSEWVGLFIPDDREKILEELHNFQTSEKENHLEFSACSELSDGNLYRVICQGDITERNQGKPVTISGQFRVDSSLSEEGSGEISDSYLLKLLMDHLPYSIYFKDHKSRFIRISDDCAGKFGLKNAKQSIGKTDFDFFDGVHARDAFADEKKILQTGEPIVGKIEAERKPGKVSEVRWASSTKLPMYNERNQIIGTFGITKDVTAQIKAEEALKESEEKYRSIFENIQDVYYRTSRDGTITEISPSIERYSGYKREEVIGSPVSKFYYKQEDREQLIKKLKADGIVTDFEVRLNHSDDKFVYTSISANIIRDDKGEIVAVDGIMRDITERKHAELKLKETYNFFDQILNTTSEGIYVINSDLQYIYWNRMMEKISGFKEGEVLGKKPDELFSHIKQYNILNSIKKALAGETSKSGDYFYEVAKTGKRGWVQAFYTPLWSEKGIIESALVTITEITDRKAIEEKLRKSDETLTKLSEQVPGAIYQFQQFPDGRSCFPFASKAFHYLYEVHPAEVKNNAEKVVERIHEEDIRQVVKSINQSFHSLEFWEQDYRVNLPVRGLCWLRGRARPEKKEDGSVIWHGYIVDITEKKQKERELNKTMDIVSDQNSRLMNFAHIVSHNLRNHAGNISSLLSLYEEENSEEEKIQLLTYLNMASTRLNEAISDLNEIIDQQAGSGKNISRLNLYDYFCKIKEILSTTIIINNVSFDVSIPENFEIDYNPAYLESILLNLISNAIKYKHPGRSPVITIMLNYEKCGGPVLTVQDNGVGIDMEKYGERLFGMYNTFHKNEDSKGIGLYITKNQIESMGGSIEVESEVGIGTTFRVMLTCDMQVQSTS